MAYEYEIVHAKHEYLMRYHSKKYFWEDQGSRRAGKLSYDVWRLVKLFWEKQWTPEQLRHHPATRIESSNMEKAVWCDNPWRRLELCTVILMEQDPSVAVNSWCSCCDTTKLDVLNVIQWQFNFGLIWDIKAYVLVVIVKITSCIQPTSGHVIIYNSWHLASQLMTEYIIYMSFKCALVCELIDVPSMCPRSALVLPTFSHHFLP